METEEKVVAEAKSSFLIPQEKYLETGIHIGTRFKTIDMKPFVFKMRDDGLYILDLRKIDERVRQAAKIIAKYRPEDVIVVASRLYSANAAEKFSALTGVGMLRGRFVPGTMTNIKLPVFKEPKLLIVCDPKGEWEAIREAAMTGVPVIALCDTDNYTSFVDWVVPSNNKGRRSLAVIFYLLTRELMMSQGKISSYDQFEYGIEHFERFEEGEEKAKQAAKEATPAGAEAPAEAVQNAEAAPAEAKPQTEEEVRAQKAIEEAKAEKAKQPRTQSAEGKKEKKE